MMSEAGGRERTLSEERANVAMEEGGASIAMRAGEGDHASYNVAKKVLAFVYQVAIPRSHLRATYGDGFQGAPLCCIKRQEEGSFTRVAGACDEQAFSQEIQDSGGADHV